MILTELTPEYARQVLQLGRDLWQESRFNMEPYDEQRVWNLLENTLKRPTKFFIAFNVIEEKITGFIIMGISEHYFSGQLLASDYCVYIAPQHRGGRQIVRLLDSAEEWCKMNGAKSMTIYHNTGINTDKSPTLFNKLGFDMKGYIFSKEIEQCVG